MGFFSRRSPEALRSPAPIDPKVIEQIKRLEGPLKEKATKVLLLSQELMAAENSGAPDAAQKQEKLRAELEEYKLSISRIIERNAEGRSDSAKFMGKLGLAALIGSDTIMAVADRAGGHPAEIIEFIKATLETDLILGLIILPMVLLGFIKPSLNQRRNDQNAAQALEGIKNATGK
jgi:hypothetical protein